MNIYRDEIDVFETEDFRHTSNLAYILSEKIGIRAALDHYSMLRPEFAAALEEEWSGIFELDFLADLDDAADMEIDGVLSEKDKKSIAEMLEKFRK